MPQRAKLTVDSIKRQLGEVVYQLRLERDLTQQQLADRSGLTRQHVQRLEAGSVNPSLGTLVGVAKGLKVHLAELLRFVYQDFERGRR